MDDISIRMVKMCDESIAYNFLPRAALVNIYKTFFRPHLDYGDVIYENSLNETFCQMIESVQ